MLTSGCSEKTVDPFLKWAGGKRWLVKSHSHFLPHRYNSYYEPFLGSGSVYFHLQPNHAVLSDSNQALIDTYKAIRSDWRKVLVKLKHHQRLHCAEYYYQVRGTEFISTWARAAKFIYLNRTCFNALYRVNLKGEFNVPIGTKNKVILDSDDFEACSKLLKKTRIECADFENIIKKARKGDFLYVDPPYTVKHNNNNFVKYNESIFSWSDQERLAKCLAEASNRGVQMLISNADHKSVRSLYKGIGRIASLERSSVLSGKKEGRGRYREIVVTNFHR